MVVLNVFQLQKIKSVLKGITPRGYFLGYEEIYSPGNQDPSFFEPVLVRNDPHRMKDVQDAAYFYPGRGEPCVYSNPVKARVIVKPLNTHYLTFLSQNPNIVDHLSQTMTQTQIALDDIRQKISVSDQKLVDQIKTKLLAILGDRYLLKQIITTDPWVTFPVVVKSSTGSIETLCAYLYPGKHIDNLDISPRKGTAITFEIPPAKLNFWLFKNADFLDRLEEAIKVLEIPKKFVP